MTPELAVGGVLLVALVLYALGGGADFGGGVWDLLAHGPTAERQRRLIAHAIGPIWEANHVWLVLVVVLLFVAFPPAFAALGIALHLPLTAMLIGIVLRGSAFTFRAYGGGDDASQRRWGTVFAVSSVITPIMLGVCVGAVFAGGVRLDPRTGHPVGGYVEPWLAPFPLAVGVFALALCSFLAATYLTVEAKERDLQRAFRARALASGIATGVLAWGCVLLARDAAPFAHAGLMERDWSPAFQVGVGACAVAALVALAIERYAWARAFAVVQVALVVAGWGFAQYPYVLHPSLTLAEAAAPREVLRPMLWTLAAGALLLLPSLAALFAVFKGRERD